MARYAYDVNTTQRYIDVHKQFRGGLKTVDTDDALGAVFLRDAQNVSLSEFGFIEKRYGTYENFKAALPTSSSPYIQGYWEFLGKYIVIAFNGHIYWQLLSSPETIFTKIDTLYKVEGLKYSENIGQHLSATVETDTYIGGFDFFQKDRLMGAVNIASVLYIFTGKYPIYLVEENSTLKAYLFSKEDPTYAELVVTGHNLLEDDYDELYYGEIDPVELIGTTDDEEEKFIIKDGSFSPKIPFAKEGTLEFNLSYDYLPSLATDFVLDTVNETQSFYNEVVLNKIQARPSGPGSSDYAYTDIDLNSVEYNELNNINDDTFSSTANVLSAPLVDGNNYNYDGVLITQDTQAVTTNLTVTDLNTTTIYEKYWGNPGTSSNPVNLVYKADFEIINTGTKLFEANAKKLEILVDDFDTELLEAGKTLSFSIQNNSDVRINLEEKIQSVRNTINTYRGFSLGDKVLESDIFISGSFIHYVIYFKVGAVRIMPIFDYYLTGTSIEGHSMEYELTQQGYINVDLYNNSDVPFLTDTISYVDDLGVEKTLIYSEIQNKIAMRRDERDNLDALGLALNQGTSVELYKHPNAGDAGTLLGTYKLGVDEEFFFEDGLYSFTIPSGIIDQSANHYSWKFKSVDVNITNTAPQSTFLGQSLTSGDFYTIPNPNNVWSGNVTKYFYPSLSQIKAVSPESYFGIHQNTFNYNIYELTNFINLEALDFIGSANLYAKIKEGLLSGTYDFRFEYLIKQTSINYATLTLGENPETTVASFVVKDVTITEEKLNDYTFFQGDKAHPIWSCNNVIEHFGKLMVWGSDEMPTALFYSFPDRPFYFPSFFYLDFTNEEDKPLVNVTPYMNILVAQTEDQTWGIRGNSGLVDAPSPYIEFSINSTVGTIAPKSVRPVRNHLFFLSKQGVIVLKSLYAADEQYNIDFVDRNIRNIVPQESGAVGIQFDNQYWLNFPKERITLRWYIDKKAWVLDKYDAWSDFNGVFKYQIKDGKLEFISLPSKFTQNENLAIYKIGVDYSLPTDLGDTVFSKFETSYLNQNYPFHPKNYKEAKFDFTLQNEYNISRDSIYEMEFSEHIADGITHTIDNVTLTKNHRYRIVYSFSGHSPDEDLTSGGDFTGLNVPSDIISGGDFDEAPTIIFGAVTFSILGADDLQITSVVLTDKDNHQTVLLPNEGFNIIEKDNFDYYVEFLLPNDIDGIVDIIVTGEFSTYNDGAVIYDITYDSELRLYNWIISEDQTLNLDNLSSYDQSKAEFNIDFNSRLGTWVFGTSDFGNKITAVKTEKLSGKGYNAKVYVEDYTKSKWTLESLGLTYKMKRARSR